MLSLPQFGGAATQAAYPAWTLEHPRTERPPVVCRDAWRAKRTTLTGHALRDVRSILEIQDLLRHLALASRNLEI